MAGIKFNPAKQLLVILVCLHTDLEHGVTQIPWNKQALGQAFQYGTQLTLLFPCIQPF